jgi:hypothetical protein
MIEKKDRIWSFGPYMGFYGRVIAWSKPIGWKPQAG